MWTSQVYGHHDKMARTKTHRTSQNTEFTKTPQTLRKNYKTWYKTMFYLANSSNIITYTHTWMYILGSGASYSSIEHTHPSQSIVLLIRAWRAAHLLLYSLDAVVCASGMGFVPLTNASSTRQDGSITHERNFVETYNNFKAISPWRLL